MSTRLSNSPSPEPEDAPAYDRPSKTRLKKEMHELQDLGEALVALPESHLTGLAVSEGLLDAVAQYKRTKTHEGKRRQMQYIGKLMRRNDAEPIREAVAAMQLGQAKDSLALHEAERWRVELLASDDASSAVEGSPFASCIRSAAACFRSLILWEMPMIPSP